MFLCWATQTPPRARALGARARTRWEVCIAHNRKDAMLAYELKWTLNDDRSVFQIKSFLVYVSLLCDTGPSERARVGSARARTPALGFLHCPQ